MIQVQNNDTIIDIAEQIEKQGSGNVIVSFPVGHPLVHNNIALKILKSKVGNRDLTIISHDRIWKKIWKKLWINFSHVGNKNFLEKSSQNTLMKYNFSIWEYIVFQVKNYKQELKNFFSKNKQLKYLQKNNKKYQQVLPLHLVFISLLVSLWVFVFIYYFAISKTYVYITPEITVKKEALNFIFQENTENSILWWNKKIKISREFLWFKSEEIFWSTDFDVNDSELSRWTIIIYNELPEEQKLIKNTRFHTKRGLEFIIEEWVSIPAWIIDNFWNISPWSIETSIVAQKKDIYNNVIWKRGNIPKDTPLSIPGLPDEVRQSVYGETTEDFTWGASNYKKKIGIDDIENAKNIFTEKIKIQAYNKIQEQIREKNTLNNTNLKILWWSDSIQYSNIEIFAKDISAWDIRDTFPISWSVDISIYVFNASVVVAKLKTIIAEKTLLWIEKISSIDESSLRFSQMIYSQTKPFELKWTYEVDYFVLHDFDNEDSSYIRNMIVKIQWLNKDEALKVLINDPRISKAEIKVRPFFVQTISNIYNNIVIKIDEK